MASSGSEKREIYGLALTCEDLFLKCYTTPHFLPSETGEKAELQHERFRIWSSHLGVFASYNASLDKRLEYCDDIRNLVIQLLVLMRTNLEFVNSQSAAHSVQHISISSALENNRKLQGTASEALNGVESAINRLQKLASAIRRQSATGIDRRVKAFTEKHGDDDYAEFARQIIQFRYKTIPPSLKEQLALSMAARRQRLRYLRRHQMKLEGQSMKKQKESSTSLDVSKTPSPGVRFNEVVAAARPTSIPVRQAWPKNVALQPAQMKGLKAIPANSDTNATTFKPTQSLLARIRKADAGSIISSSKASTTFMAQGLDDYPEPPKARDGQAQRPCSFCLQPLAASGVKTRHWKKHVDQDIKPLICLSVKCNEPPFETFDLWARHMRDSHSAKWPQLIHKPLYWRCDVDHPKDMPAYEFDNEIEFDQHVETHHGNYSPAVKKAISRTNRVQRRRPPKICPLCSYDVSSLDPDNNPQAGLSAATKRPSEFEELDKLAKHIASHLRRLAFDSVNNLDADSQSDVSLESILASKGKRQSSPGTPQRRPSGPEDLSQMSTDFFENPPRHGRGNEFRAHDKDWSEDEFNFLQSLDVELDDLSTPNWDEVKLILKKSMERGTLLELEQHQKSASCDGVLQHFSACQIPAYLLDEAYDKVKKENPGLVGLYEKVLSFQLQQGALRVEIPDGQQNDIPQNDTYLRRQQMTQLLQFGKDEIEDVISREMSCLDATGDRIVVNCHNCGMEWWHDEQGMKCPRCKSKATKIVMGEHGSRYRPRDDLFQWMTAPDRQLPQLTTGLALFDWFNVSIQWTRLCRGERKYLLDYVIRRMAWYKTLLESLRRLTISDDGTFDEETQVFTENLSNLLYWLLTVQMDHFCFSLSGASHQSLSGWGFEERDPRIMREQIRKMETKFPEKRLIFRISNIPRDLTWSELKSCLLKQDVESAPAIRSLQCDVEGGFKTGIIAVRNLAIPLGQTRPGERWSIKLQAEETESLSLDEDFLGMTVLYVPHNKDHEVDIIAVPGIGDHAWESFCHAPTNHMWLLDALPHDLIVKGSKRIARVLTYGYNWSNAEDFTAESLSELIRSFRDSLQPMARAPVARPIVLLATGFGALLVQHTLVMLSKSKSEADQRLCCSVYGVVFFGSPPASAMHHCPPKLLPMDSRGKSKSQEFAIQSGDFHKALGYQGDAEIMCFYDIGRSRSDTGFTAGFCRPWEDDEEHVCPISLPEAGSLVFEPGSESYAKVRDRLKALCQRSVSNYAAKLTRRYERTGDPGDLEEAIFVARQDAPIGQGRVLANLLGARYASRGDSSDLDEAIGVSRLFATSTNMAADDNAVQLKNIGTLFQLRFLATRAIADLDEAHSALSEAVFVLRRRGASTISCICKSSLASFLIQRNYIGSGEGSDQERALEFMIQVSCYRTYTICMLAPIYSLMTSYELAVALSNRTRFRFGRAVAKTISLALPLSAHSDDMLAFLSQVSLPKALELASEAAAFQLNQEQKAFSVLETLETGRLVLASSFDDVCTELPALQQQHPGLAASFVALRRQLNRSHVFWTNKDDETNAQKCSTDMDHVLQNIRRQPGFERFFLAPTESAMRQAASRGPIVVCNVSFNRCDALIVELSGITLLRLPQLTRDDIVAHLGHTQSTSTLAWLWDVLVEPVLNHIGFTEPPRHGDGWPRMWWIPTGPLVSFPLHAAGRHSEHSTATALDRVISSYGSSIKTIILSRGSRPDKGEAIDGPRVALVGVSSASGMPPLPSVLDEIGAIQTICDSNQLSNSRPETSRDEVLSSLKSCDVFHFAGPSVSHATNPQQTTLVLTDWKTSPLTIKRILETVQEDRLPFLAYLSCCGTEPGSGHGVPLPSSFQLSGFRHAIGYLAEVDDMLCKRIATQMYSWLVTNGIGDGSISSGLHHAAKVSRDQWLKAQEGGESGSHRCAKVHGEEEQQQANWAGFLHYGV